MGNLETEGHVLRECKFAKDMWLRSPVRSSFMVCGKHVTLWCGRALGIDNYEGSAKGAHEMPSVPKSLIQLKWMTSFDGWVKINVD
ncbi:hypothetical protein DVH24_005410 [Malus domestica]|uniref:Uncharacterized protein n=1 Tax=Malus domestica TaxID=3750 RepID=A0A498KJJ3_MALDO|nr:hypothetical protein DVH24_005410 [Malus domestica]